MAQPTNILSFPGDDRQIDAVPVDTPIVQTLKSRKQRRRQGRYVKGPIAWSSIIAATKAHPRGPAVYLAIKMLADSTGKDEVALPSELCSDLGIGREMKRRILSALTEVGLVEIRQASGQLVRVRLPSTDTAGPTES